MLPTTSLSAPHQHLHGLTHSIPLAAWAGVSLETWWASATQAAAPMPGMLRVGFAGGTTMKDLQRWLAPPHLCPSAHGKGTYPEAPGHN